MNMGNMGNTKDTTLVCSLYSFRFFVTASHIPWAPARALLDSGSAFRSTVLLSPFAAHRAFLAASRNRGCSVDGCAASFPGSLRPRCRPSGYRPRFYRRLLPFLLAAPVVRDSWPSTPCSPLARQHWEGLSRSMKHLL